MSGTVVQATSEDSVRIVDVTSGLSLTIPAALILALDGFLRRVRDEPNSLSVDPVEDDATGWEGFEARSDDGLAHGDTPWQAIAELAGRGPSYREYVD